MSPSIRFLMTTGLGKKRALSCSVTYQFHIHKRNYYYYSTNYYHLLLPLPLLLLHPFNGPFSGNTRVSRYQKGKANLDFTKARVSEWQWHQLDHMQVCPSLQTDNHASTHHSVFYRLDALPAAQPTVSKHWRPNIHKCNTAIKPVTHETHR